MYRQMVLNDINSNRHSCTEQMVLNDIKTNRYCVQANGIDWYWLQSILCTGKWYWMILIAIDIVYRQMVLNDINSNRCYVQTNGIEWY